MLIAIGIVRIVSTYHVFNHTIDEDAHLACGIQWFQRAYTYDPKHTPLARISIALMPYLDGVRGYGDPSFWQEGVLELSSGGHYWRNLALARLGVLPYFVLATLVIFIWTRRVYGSATALLAAGIFSMLPVVLAHSAVATTDIPLTAFYITAVYAFTPGSQPRVGAPRRPSELLPDWRLRRSFRPWRFSRRLCWASCFFMLYPYSEPLLR